MSSPVGVVLARSVSSSFVSESMEDSGEMTAGQKRFVFVLLVLMLFTGQLGYAVFSPFFPQEAEDKGVNGTVQGLIFGSFQLVVLIFTPVGMKLVPILGPTNLLNITNFLIGGANVAFGFVWYVGAGLPFTIACFACRIVAGIGVSVAMVVGYGLLPFLFGDRLSTGSSILETAIGLAFIAAPVLGGALFTVAGGDETGLGYVVPFIVLGVAQLILGVYTLVYFPTIPTPSSSDSRISYFSPRVLLPCILCCVAAGAIEYMSPTLEPMLRDDPFGFSIAGVSGVFAVCSGVYVVAGPLVGIFDDHFEGRYALPTMGIGMIGLGFGYIFLGPALFLPEMGLELSMLNMWVGIVVIGISTALALIPTYNNMYRWAKHQDEDDKANATSVLYNLFYAAGAWLGPTVGGAVGQAVGIPESYTMLGLFSIVAGVLTLGFYMIVRKSESEVARETSMTESMLPVEDGKIVVNVCGQAPADSQVSTTDGGSAFAPSSVDQSLAQSVQ